MPSNKSILITGADGFIGSHLTELLAQKGNKIRALSYYNSFNNWGWLEDVSCKEEIEIISGDVRDPEFCRKLMKDIDLVFHLAALIAIPYSYSSPNSYIDTNVKGTLNICQAALDKGVQRILVTSTSEVYGTARYVPIDENHPLQPQSPYSASKIGADAIAMSYFYSFRLPLTVIRPFNTYGPRQSARAVIPTIITQLLAGKVKIHLGSLSPTRDLNYVSDIVEGFCKGADSEKAIGEIINLGSNREISIGDLANTIARLMNVTMAIESAEERQRPEHSEVERLLSDNTRARELLGWSPSVTLEEGLRKTIEWFQTGDHLTMYKSGIYNI
jgi:NAD dependent epimerase/dehydratase